MCLADKIIFLSPDSNTEPLSQNDWRTITHGKQKKYVLPSYFWPQQCSINNTLIMWVIIVPVTFCLLPNNYWPPCPVHRHELDSFLECYNLHTSISISTCCQYEVPTEALKHVLSTGCFWFLRLKFRRNGASRDEPSVREYTCGDVTSRAPSEMEDCRWRYDAIYCCYWWKFLAELTLIWLVTLIRLD